MNKLYIWCDGSVREGASGIGYVIKNEQNKILREKEKLLDKNYTNNQTEYIAVIEALKDVRSFAPKSVTVISDSKLVVSQTKNEWTVRSENLKEFHKQLKTLIRKCKFPVRLIFVSRYKNKEANKLAQRVTKKAVRELKNGKQK
jgi:ribonuclease HI